GGGRRTSRDLHLDLVLAGLVDRGDVELRIGRDVTPEDDAALVEIEASALEGVPAAYEADLAGDEERFVGLFAETDLPAQLDVGVAATDPGVAIDADLDVERECVGDVDAGRGGPCLGLLLAADHLDRGIALEARPG